METGCENPSAPLQIFVDAPSSQDDEFATYGSSRVSRLMLWMLEKCSLQPEEVGLNFTIRCCTTSLKKKIEKEKSIEACAPYSDETVQNAKSLLGLGELSAKRLTGQSLDRVVYQEHKKILHCPVYIGYSPGYLLQKVGETVDVVRMIWWAAKTAGLNPKVNTELADFDFGQI